LISSYVGSSGRIHCSNIAYSDSNTRQEMGDSWEDWSDDEAIAVPAPVVARPAADQFADEDLEEDGPKYSVPEQQEVRCCLMCVVCCM